MISSNLFWPSLKGATGCTSASQLGTEGISIDLEPNASSASSVCQRYPTNSDFLQRVPTKGILSLTLSEYCDEVQASPEALNARVHSVSQWVDIEGIPHKFLTLHVQWPRSSEIFYIRLDRRRSRRKSSISVLSQSLARDEVTIAGSLERLLDQTPVKQESKMTLV